MSNHELLQNYSNSIRRLRKQCLDAGMSEDEYKKLYFESLESVQNSANVATSRSRRIINRRRIAILGLILIVYAVYNIKSIYTCLVCNMQEYIYPGLRLLRRLSIPLISLFPSLTDFYHETCLIQNPFFTVVDMDCWPCSTINNVRQVYDPKPVTQQQTAPFIYETDQPVIKMTTLKDLYTRNKDVFDKDSPKILINNKYYLTTSEFFQNNEEVKDKNLFIWKLNNMNAGRILRQVIPRPKVVPKFGQSTERFIIVDSSQKSFMVPDTECAFSFLLALSGSRTVDLKPAEECKHQCKSLRVELRETYLLWYNWWYWRPEILPSNGNSTLIAHIGSYC